MSKHVSSLSSCLFPRQRAAITHHTAKRDASQALAPPSGATPRAPQRVESRGLPGACTGTTQRYQLGHLDGPRAKARERHRLAASDGTRRVDFISSTGSRASTVRPAVEGDRRARQKAWRSENAALQQPPQGCSLQSTNKNQSLLSMQPVKLSVPRQRAAIYTCASTFAADWQAGSPVGRSPLSAGRETEGGPRGGVDPRRVNTPLCRHQ